MMSQPVVDMSSQYSGTCPPRVLDTGSGFTCRTAFVSPICYPGATHFADSSISVSNSKFSSPSGDGPQSQALGYTPQRYSSMNIVRRPLRQLSSNTQPIAPLIAPYNFEGKSSISPNATSSQSTQSMTGGYENTSVEENGQRYSLPSWVMDAQGHIIVPLHKVLEDGLLEAFSKDKIGCTFLQTNYPGEGAVERDMLVKQLFERNDLFKALCGDVFGNFFIQCVVEHATLQEQRLVVTRLLGRELYSMCLNRYSCRVIQKVLECLPEEMKSLLLCDLHNCNLVALCTDQNANHVVQKIMTSFDLSHWLFIVEHFILNTEDLFRIAEDKYGCRVIQLIIEVLSDTTKKYDKCRAPMLEKLMDHLVSNCERLSSNEFANYVIQHVIKSSALADYRDRLIEECLLKNILSLSQEKYASHVIEKALEFAPPVLLAEMMDEIFDGYVPHPETKKDALDIMLFHQYGNYVVQRMLDICREGVFARRDGKNLPDLDKRLAWLNRLETRIAHNRHRLARYSSGKKILATLQQLSESAITTTSSGCRGTCVKTSVPSKYR
ncbi:Pumilio domain member 9 [Parelaphostrongylus tenuis]|uniref:Pumilio domain member 9 n=1 Tax=Parelaphostrongylus tenuis TaxID=148309 RepID=A0AAD5LV21_PARTN|nr:Pumilio domain member 9 [Parelaphostrongylus tenuis]